MGEMAIESAVAARATAAPDVFPRCGEIRVHDTSISVWEEHVDGPAMQAVFSALRRHLRRRGFVLAKIKRIAKCIRDNYRDGRKGDLEVYAETAGRTAKVEFFQNVANVDNPNGGRYDFDKLTRMPRVLRLRCAVEMAATIRFLVSLGYALGKDLREPLAMSVLRIGERRVEEGLTPLERFNRGWGADRFKRGADGWPVESERDAYYRDQDGRRPEPGDVRCLYHLGRLIRGTVYPNMNSMFTVHLADGSWITQASAGELFSVDRDAPRRQPLTPKKQAERLEHELKKATGAKDWKRVATLGKVLARFAAAQS